MKLSVLSKTPTANAGSILLGFPKSFLSFLWDHPPFPNILKLHYYQRVVGQTVRSQKTTGSLMLASSVTPVPSTVPIPPHPHP